MINKLHRIVYIKGQAALKKYHIPEDKIRAVEESLSQWIEMNTHSSECARYSTRASKTKNATTNEYSKLLLPDIPYLIGKNL